MWLFAGLAGVAPRLEAETAEVRDPHDRGLLYRFVRLERLGIHVGKNERGDRNRRAFGEIGRLSESATRRV
jgi:hypothetical protein